MDVIRPRRPEDLPLLAQVLADQQPLSRYPVRWPLPFPAEEFLERPGTPAAWTAERDGVIVGHVCVQTPATAGADSDVLDPAMLTLWEAGAGRPASQLGVVSALFTAAPTWGSGLGGRLLTTAVDWLRERDLTPCLDMTQGPGPAQQVYAARGWRVVGEMVPDWLPPGEPPVLVMVLPTEA